MIKSLRTQWSSALLIEESDGSKPNHLLIETRRQVQVTLQLAREKQDHPLLAWPLLMASLKLGVVALCLYHGIAPDVDSRQVHLKNVLSPEAQLKLERIDSFAFECNATPILIDEALALSHWILSQSSPQKKPTLRVFQTQKVVAPLFIASFVLFVFYQIVLAPRMISLGKPVTTSSDYPGSSFHAQLVDGKRDHRHSVHTKVEDVSWVEIDLQDIYSISEIRVFARRDGFIEESLPMVVEIEDGRGQYTVLEELKQARNDWKIDGKGKKARRVRIRKPTKGYIALGEVEVMGKK